MSQVLFPSSSSLRNSALHQSEYAVLLYQMQKGRCHPYFLCENMHYNSLSPCPEQTCPAGFGSAPSPEYHTYGFPVFPAP